MRKLRSEPQIRKPICTEATVHLNSEMRRIFRPFLVPTLTVVSTPYRSGLSMHIVSHVTVVPSDMLLDLETAPVKKLES